MGTLGSYEEIEIYKLAVLEKLDINNAELGLSELGTHRMGLRDECAATARYSVAGPRR